MLLFFLISLLFLSNSLTLDKLPARETVADDVIMGADDVMMNIQMVMKNQTGNSKSLIASLEKLDPATIASVVVLVEQLLASSAADLLALQQSFELSISAYNDALDAHNAAVNEKVRLDEVILAYQASLAQQVTVVQSTLDTKNTASGAKINAQATLAEESPRLNSESSTLTQVLELINGLTAVKFTYIQSGTCESNGYASIHTAENCEAAAAAMGKPGKFYIRNDIGNGRPTGCSWHEAGFIELWTSSSGDCNIWGYDGCFCTSGDQV